MKTSYLSPQLLARVTRVGESTYSSWRRRGVGPVYVDCKYRHGYGPRYFYRVSDVLAYTGGKWPQTGRFLKTEHAAKLMGITPATLRQRRHRGGGPAPVYFESLVRYLPDGLS